MRPVSLLISRPRLAALACSLALTWLAPGACQAAFAADDASLDSVWMDQADKSAKTPATTTSPPPIRMEMKGKAKEAKAPVAKTSAGTSTGSSTGTSTSTAAVNDTSAPMCTVEAFKNSALVSKGGWPGVGPFKSNDRGSYVDDHQNKVTLELSGDRITRAELTLPNRQLSNPPKDLLDMQMHIDFLLEAVGIKPKKIQELNALLDKNKAALLRNDDAPLNLTTGRFLINIEKRKEADSSLDYVVAVNSLDADKKILKEHSVSDDLRPTLPTVTHQSPSLAQPGNMANSSQDQSIAETQEGLKDQFATLIKDWQSVKKNAVRTWQTQELASVLSGRALVRQTDAVKWLLTNKKYYELNPKGVLVERFTEIQAVPAKKYSVAAQVHEAYKFIDEPTGHVLKEVDDVNRVTYTVERQNGKWVITDSAMQVSPQANKSSSATSKTTTH